MSNALRLSLPLLLTVLFIAPVRADLIPDQEVKKIRAAFKAVKKADLYRTEVAHNAGDDPAPAVGPYSKKIVFHFDWVPGEKPALRRAEVKLFAGTREERLYFRDASLFRYLKGKRTIDEIGEAESMIEDEVELDAAAVQKLFAAIRELQPT